MKKDKNHEKFQKLLRSKTKYSHLLSWPTPVELSRMDACELHDLAWSELGKSLLYMKFMHPPECNWGTQVKRVYDLCNRLVLEGNDRRFPNSPKNRKWFRQFLSEIADEVENQCWF